MRTNQRQRARILLIFSVVFLAAVAISGTLCHDAAMVTDFSRKNLAPCFQYPFGTDWLGRNMFYRTLTGLSMSILIGICIPGWIGMARQVRGQLIALKEQEFSMAALVLGASDARILFKHLIVNAIGPIIVQVTFLVPNAIFTEAFLSFIGIGISAPMASWGSMAQDARQILTMYPSQLLLPTVCICITIFSLNFLGEGIGDAFNPKKK